MLRNLYLALGSMICFGYATASMLGWEYTSAPRKTLAPGSVRQSPGGHRSYFFWHSGYRGGK